MRRKEQTQEVTAQASKTSWGRLILVGVALLSLIVLFTPLGRIILPFWLPDEVPDTLRIENRTGEHLILFNRFSDGSEERIPFVSVAPHTSMDSPFPCAAGQLVARTLGGREVSSRGPFDRCNLEPWVITP